MRALGILLHNLVGGLVTITQNLLKALWVKPPPPDFVTFELRGDPPYRRASWRHRLAARLGGRPASLDLHTLSRHLEEIGRSEIVRGVVFRVDGLEASFGKLESLREMVETLQDRGKEVVFWTPQADSRQSLLVLSASRVFLPPAGRLDLRGFAVEALTVGAALQKVGARAHVFRRGTHKSAGELLSRDGISDAHRETLDHVLDGLFGRLTAAIARGRRLDDTVAPQRISEGPYTAQGAQAAGLIDGICYGDELSARLAEDGRETARLVPWPAFRATIFEPMRWRPVLASRQGVGIVPVRGLIAEGESRVMPGGLRVCGARTVGERLAEVRRDRSVKAVVLHIDSRGGSALASDLMWREVRRTAERKPVIAFLDQVAASGGYYVASAADRIVATPTVLTGSIGVLAVLLDLEDLYRRAGVRREILARGEKAALGTTARPPTDPEKAALEALLEDTYRTFIDRVAEGRGLSTDAVAERAEGQVHLGTRALELDLVDRLGGFEDALREARDAAAIPQGTEVELSFHDTGPSGLLTRLPPLGGARDLGALVTGRPLVAEALALAGLHEPILAWAPFELRG